MPEQESKHSSKEFVTRSSEDVARELGVSAEAAAEIAEHPGDPTPVIEPGPGAYRSAARVVDEDKLLETTDKLSDMSADQLPGIRAGLEQRGLVVDEDDPTAQGALTHGLKQAERDAAVDQLQELVNDKVRTNKPVEQAQPASGPDKASQDEIPKTYVTDRDQALDQALAMDSAAAAQAKTYEHYNKIIDGTTDQAMVAPLKEARDKAAVEARNEQVQQLATRARAIPEQMAAEDTYTGNIKATADREQKQQQDQAQAQLDQQQQQLDQNFRLGTDVFAQNKAMDEALREDPEAAQLNTIGQRFDKLIDGTPDQLQKKALVEERNRVMDEHRAKNIEHATSEAKRLANIAIQAADVADAAIGKGRRHEAGVATLDTAGLTPDQIEEQALARRKALGVESLPFYERKRGGLAHIFERNAGPKLLESYFRVPGEDNLMMLERRNRRTGELISQNILTTEQPLRHTTSTGPNGTPIDSYFPPAKAAPMVDQIRDTDRQHLVARAGGGVLGRLGSKNIADYISGPDSPAINGTNGVYARRYGADAHELYRFTGGETKRRGNLIQRLLNTRL